MVPHAYIQPDQRKRLSSLQSACRSCARLQLSAVIGARLVRLNRKGKRGKSGLKPIMLCISYHIAINNHLQNVVISSPTPNQEVPLSPRHRPIERVQSRAESSRVKHPTYPNNRPLHTISPYHIRPRPSPSPFSQPDRSAPESHLKHQTSLH